jgi:heterotetrameric sarcosine oxidase gamma subunit
MVDPKLARRSPLQSYVEQFRAAGRDDTVRLRELPFLPMTDLRGEQPPGVTQDGHLLRLGPDWWLLVGQPPAGEGVDVSAHRTTLELHGPRARDVLMTGCSIDLYPPAFPVGACAQTLLAQAQVVLHRVAPDTYRLLVRASFAGYLADWLLDAMVEHGEGV